MAGIQLALRAVVSISVDGLKEIKAPTSIGYNDMAVMIAFGQSAEMGIPSVNSRMISEYLKKHPAVPADARMTPEGVQPYLDELVKYALIERQQNPGDYKMRDEMSECIFTDYARFKSPHIDDFMFHGFTLHSAWAIDKERRKG